MRFTPGFGCAPLLALTLTSCSLEKDFSEAFFWPANEEMAVPSDFGLAYEEEQIQTGSDTSVHGWFIPAANANGRTVVFCHGNGINITYCQPYYQFLHDAGFNVFLYDYRGFGKSWGAVSMDAMLSDMTYVMDYVRSRDDVDPQKIALYGVSIGTLAALRGAARYTGVVSVVVEDVVNLKEFEVQGDREVPSFLMGYMAIPWALDPETSAGELDVPLMYLSGSNHKDLGLQFRIYRAVDGPKSMWVIPGAGHAPTPLLVQDREYQAAVGSFLEQSFAGQPESVAVSYRSRQRGPEWVIQVTVSRRGSTDTSPWPVEISFLHQRKIRFERVWLEREEQTFDFVLTDRPLGSSGWRYRFVEGDPSRETWEPSRSSLAKAHRVYEALVGNTRSLRAADSTVELALRAVDAIEQQEDREPFSAALNAELSELYWLVGKTLYGSSDEEQRTQGLEWLERCLTAIPDEPKKHYWPSSEELVGFHHGASVAQASMILADVYRGDGRNTDALKVLEAAAEVAPDDRAVQQKLGELRDGQD